MARYCSGKRDATSIKLVNRKGVLKPHTNTGMFKKSIGVPAKSGERITQARVNGKDSTRMSKAINVGGVAGKSSLLNGMSLRPPIDVRRFRQQMMERARQLDETLQTDEGCSNGLNHTIIKLPSNRACSTPKPSGLSRAYIKLSESRMKSGLLKKAASSGTVSPFEERIIQKEGSKEISKGSVVSCENILVASNITHSKTSSGDGKVKENDSACVVGVANGEHPPKKASNIENGAGNNVNDKKNENCALRNVLKHCQLYSSNMMNIHKAMNVLDEAFESAMVGEIGSHLRARFCDYQNGKRQLYKKMEFLEEELEKSIKDEVDIPSKFNDYLATRRNIMKECRDLQENFENFIKQMIRNKDEEIRKRPKCEKLEEVMKGLVSSEERLVERGEATLRRSQRLLAVPKISDAQAKNGGTPSRRRRKSTEKECEIKEELVLKRRSKSYDKKSIQSRIYKDLQESFNLCSPECSF